MKKLISLMVFLSLTFKMSSLNSALPVDSFISMKTQAKKLNVSMGELMLTKTYNRLLSLSVVSKDSVISYKRQANYCNTDLTTWLTANIYEKTGTSTAGMQAQLNGTGKVVATGTVVSYDNTAYAPTSSLTPITTSISALNSSVTANGSSISALTSSVTTNNSSISSLTSSVTTNNSSISSLTSSVSVNTTSITALNALAAVTVSTAITNTNSNIGVWTTARSLTSDNDFKWDVNNDILTMGLSSIQKSTIGGITSNAMEFRSGSTIGVFSFMTNGTNAASRFYIMPNGTPTGTTAKLEVFNTHYASGSANYNGFNLFCNNSSNTIFMGGNVAGSATRLRMVIAGKYNASVVDAGSNAITFETDETLRINETGGGVGVGGAAVASAKLAITSTTQGFLPPVMNSTQGAAISSPATGLLIYVTNTNGTFASTGWWGYNGSAWEKLNN